MNIDEMPAGRELDFLIAEQVMGWHVSRLYATPRFWNPALHDKLHYSCDEPDEAPHCSTDMAAAWEVVEKLIADGATPYIYHAAGHWVVQLSGLGCRVSANTAPLAICRAALKAVAKSDP